MSEEKTENLFIGGFPVQTTAEELRAYFSGYKSVQSVRIVNNPKGESKGFGFISLSDPNEVDSIIRTVHKIHGKMFRVKKVLDKSDIAKVKDDEIHRKIFLGGLNKSTTESGIENYFSKLGEIEDILINRNIEDGSSRGCAFLLFKEHHVAKSLIEKNQLHFIDGNYVEVKQCYEKSKSKALKQDKDLEKVLEGFKNMQQDKNNFVGSILQQQRYMQMMEEMLYSFFPNNCGNYPNFTSQAPTGLAHRMMQNQSFVDSLNNSHSRVISNRSSPLAVNNLNIMDCPVYNISQKIQPDFQATQQMPKKTQDNNAQSEETKSKCPFNFSSKKIHKAAAVEPKDPSTVQRVKCPFNFGSDTSKIQGQNKDLSQTQSIKSESIANNYKKYLFDNNLLRENHPHSEDSFATFVLKHYYSSSDSESESSSVDKLGHISFQKKQADRPQSKTLSEMLKSSRRFKLLHREENMAFKPVPLTNENLRPASRFIQDQIWANSRQKKLPVN